MGILSILFIKIMVNSEIVITNKSEQKIFQQDEIQNSYLNGAETGFRK